MKSTVSAVVAAAVVHNLGSLLEDAGMISFSGAGSLFLVRQDGVEISRSGDSVPEVYNLLSLLEKGENGEPYGTAALRLTRP
ncbi:MAG: hypothetical protein LKM41_05055 [Lachnospiraceae bacterium]|nr:hypothetical protein [Lachnospiraceae bacterium]